MKVGDLVIGHSSKIDGCIGIIVDVIRPLNHLYSIMWGSGRISGHYPYEITVINRERKK